MDCLETDKTREYEAYKRYLASLDITVAEYQARLREWCEKHNF